MTKQEAKNRATQKVKEIVKRRFDYSNEAIEKYGMALIKREIFHARKEVSVIWNSLSQSWEARHQETGVI